MLTNVYVNDKQILQAYIWLMYEMPLRFIVFDDFERKIKAGLFTFRGLPVIYRP